MFLDPAERELYPEWERALATMVAGFRATVGTATDEVRLAAADAAVVLDFSPVRCAWRVLRDTKW